MSEFLFNMRSDDDSGTGRDLDDTSDLDYGKTIFEDDLDDDLEDICQFD